MRRILMLLVLLTSLGCEAEFDAQSYYLPYQVEIPTMNLPISLQERNYAGGSCVHASTEMCLRWQGLHEVAAWWRDAYSGGESFNGLTSKLDASGLKWAGTADGDVSYLDWACRTRRGAVIFYKPNHSICLVHFDEQWAGVLDNNNIGHIEYIDRDTFIRNWRGFGGVAVTPVYTPTAPLPYLGG